MLKEYTDKIEKEILVREEEKLKAKENAEKSNNEYEVEAILDKRTTKSKKKGTVTTKYLIRWKGWGEDGDSWEPEDTLNCPDLIRAFQKKNKSKSVVKATPKKKAAAKKRKLNYDSSGSEADNTDDSDYGAKRARDSGEYEVSRILNARINKHGKWEFFVMWKGFGPDDNSWEPESNLNCSKLINEVSYS